MYLVGYKLFYRHVTIFRCYFLTEAHSSNAVLRVFISWYLEVSLGKFLLPSSTALQVREGVSPSLRVIVLGLCFRISICQVVYTSVIQADKYTNTIWVTI